MDPNAPSAAAAESVSVPAATHGHSLAQELRDATGINPARCYQCGKCTAGCPMAEEMPTKPHQLVRLVQMGTREKVLSDPSIWLCLTCETCSARCPMSADPARLIDGLREIAARERPEAGPKRIAGFHQAFLEQIARHGRVYEFGLIASYKLRTGALFDDLTVAPGTFARGKLRLLPSTIDGIEDVRRIMAACAKETEHE